MFSETIRAALSKEVAGQPEAIAAVVRGVTRLISGLTPRERAWCAYLFQGPPGTGRAHLIRSLSRFLYGEERLVTVSCVPVESGAAWRAFVEQLQPLFSPVSADAAPRLVVIQDLELAPSGLFRSLARMLETGDVLLPGGARGRIDHCLVFLLTGLCTREILDERANVGFTGGVIGGADGEHPAQDAIHRTCRAEAEQLFGLELLAQLDHHILFRRLEEEHLALALDSHFGRMSRWLAQRGVTCELDDEARAFLVRRGSRQELLGARDLILAHRREVEFPLADLLLSGRLESGSSIRVERRPGENHLHFEVSAAEDAAPLESAAIRRVPVL